MEGLIGLHAIERVALVAIANMPVAAPWYHLWGVQKRNLSEVLPDKAVTDVTIYKPALKRPLLPVLVVEHSSSILL